MTFRKTTYHFILSIILLCQIVACQTSANKQNQDETSSASTERIVSLNGTTTEILAGIGLEDQIVGVDVASTYPKSLGKVPRVGHNRSISVEGILALNPTLIIGVRQSISEQLVSQLEESGVKVVLLEQEYTVDGARRMIQAVSKAVEKEKEGERLLNRLNNDLSEYEEALSQVENPSKVLFVYARGSGTMMVGGKNTPMDALIRLAGGINVAQNIDDYKPFTAEALVDYNPDVIVLFESGLASLGDVDGVMEMQGVKHTNAGKNRKIVALDGQKATGFGPRLGQAIKELAEKIKK